MAAERQSSLSREAASREEPALERPARELLRAFQPGEKLEKRGARELSSGELLTLALAGASRAPGAPAALAERLLRRPGLEKLAEMGPEAWRSAAKLGTVAAVRLSATFELARRIHAKDAQPVRPRLSRPKQAFQQVKHLAAAKKEHLVGLYLDAQNALLHQETISVGSLNTTRTHPREILYPAVLHLALGFILAHNHPSGCLEPSREDLEFTQSVQRAAELMGIELYDHLIVSRDGYTSLRERGLL